jgi:hypothetical protein
MRHSWQGDSLRKKDPAWRQNRDSRDSRARQMGRSKEADQTTVLAVNTLLPLPFVAATHALPFPVEKWKRDTEKGP